MNVKYTTDLQELGFEPEKTVNAGGNAKYDIQIVSATPTTFLAKARAVVDFDQDGTFNEWEINQDFQIRTIKVWKLIICSFFSTLYSFTDVQFFQIWKQFLFNLLFLIIQLLLVMLYFALKKRRLVNILDTYIGLGDMLFFALVALLFVFE